MFETILELIQKYDRIIIHRHTNPDGDAAGSQLGLKRLIELNFPEKEVYVVGDENNYTAFLGEMDILEDYVFEGALSIVLDVAVSYLVSDNRYELSDHVLVIDHHLNTSDIADTEINDSESIACSQIIGALAKDKKWIIDSIAASTLLTGITTDSGRYLYPKTGAETFEIVAYLINKGADMQWVYDNLYVETLDTKKLKGYFINSFQLTKNNVAYMKNDNTLKDKYNVSTFTVSRAMVNQMSGILGVEIWANFTEDDRGMIQCELRSRKYSIVDIARKYGGGGHSLACGCQLKSFDEVDLLLQDLDALLERGNDE